MDEHHQNKLQNAVRVLLNCTDENLMKESEERNRNPTWTFQWNENGYMQPCAQLGGRTKMNVSYASPNIGKLIDHDYLNLHKLTPATFVSHYVKNNEDSELIEKINENLTKGEWTYDACEMTLNLGYSHPVLDTFKFKNSKDFVYFRRLCV